MESSIENVDVGVVEYNYKDENKKTIRKNLEVDFIINNTYWIGIFIIALSIMVYSVLGVLNIMDTEHILIYLGAYLISQVSIGIIVFNHLLKKYD